MRFTIAALVLTPLLALPCFAETPVRWVPRHCLEFGDASDTERPWNESYREGWHAIERREYDVAESEMCRALLALREFDPRDWRFAETLDELGLIAFELRDFDLAEHVQGAAIAEMLLAVGPQGEPLRDVGTESQEAIRPDCRSGIRVYITRLGWIHERVSGRIDIAELRRAPWRIFEAGYLPLDADLAHRLDWLVSQYLLQENLAAADALIELQRRVLGESR